MSITLDNFKEFSVTIDKASSFHCDTARELGNLLFCYLSPEQEVTVRRNSLDKYRESEKVAAKVNHLLRLEMDK